MNAIEFPPIAAAKRIPLLENGDRLNSKEFLRRYEAMPDLKKAELVEGTVYIMSSPVRCDAHGKPDGIMATVLGSYALATPGVQFYPNTTVELDEDNTFQPDGFMRKLPEIGGKSIVDHRDFVVGPPELIVEIAASSVSIDTGRKRRVFLQHGVLEYICWLTEEDAGFHWWILEKGQYVELLADPDGITRSRVFPGFWLDVAAILANDKRRIRNVLEMGIASPEHAAF